MKNLKMKAKSYQSDLDLGSEDNENISDSKNDYEDYIKDNENKVGHNKKKYNSSQRLYFVEKEDKKLIYSDSDNNINKRNKNKNIKFMRNNRKYTIDARKYDSKELRKLKKKYNDYNRSFERRAKKGYTIAGRSYNKDFDEELEDDKKVIHKVRTKKAKIKKI